MSKPIDDFVAQIDATIDQVARATGASTMTVRRRVKAGRYASFLDGGVRKIVVASVLADRQRTIAGNAVDPMPAGPGRGHKGERRAEP